VQNFEDAAQDDVTIGRVLSIAGAGSAAAAGLMVVLDRLCRREQPTRRIELVSDPTAHGVTVRVPGSMKVSLPESVRRTGDQAKRQAALVAEQAAEIALSASREAKNQGSDARKVASDRFDRLRSNVVAKGGDLERVASRQLHQARSQAASYAAARPTLDGELLQQKGEELMNAAERSYKRARKGVEPLLESARERAPQLGHQLAEAGSERLHKLAEYTADGTHVARDKASKIDVSAVQSGIGPAAGSLRDATGRLKDDVAPAIRDAAVQAAAAAIGIWEATRAQANQIDRDEVRAQASESVSEVLDRAKRTGSAATESVTSLVHEHAGDVKERANEARERAGEVSREALESSARTTKDATSALVWAGIAGGLIYYGLLNQDQRQRVGEMVQSLYTGANELYRDIQGYDADFGSA
jgi:hypothetical protein